MNYLPYLKSKDTPNRKLRKSQRAAVFQKNRKMKAYAKREARKAA